MSKVPAKDFIKAFLLTLAFAVAVAGADASPGAPHEHESANGKYNSRGHASDYTNLFTVAGQSGFVRIIVGLNTAFQPMGALPAPQAQGQITAIAQAQNGLLASLAGHNISNIKQFKHIPYMAMEVDTSALSSLVNNPNVTGIEEDIPVPPTLAQSGPLIGADTAWASGYTGIGWTVAILDTGVESGHAFLSGKVVSEACYSTTYAPHTATTLCPNGTGSQTGAGAAALSSCGGLCDHGTHVSGIAAGSDPGGLGYSGVAKAANIIAVQVFSKFSDVGICGGSAPCVMSYTSDQILGLDRVYTLRSTYNIAAVNMSLGGGRYYDQASCDSANSAIKAAIDNLRSVGIATVIASGNSYYKDSISAPGCVSTAISVGSSCDYTGTYCVGGPDTVASYSNSASFLSLLAPGSLITSSVPGGGYSAWHGTSMAAPQVTGAWAVIKASGGASSVPCHALYPPPGTDDVVGGPDTVASYSNSASFLSLLAPGSLITSSVPGGGYSAWHGTSMAAPQVTGAWAVIKASGGASSVSGVLSLLQSTGISVTDTNGITKPRIQVDTATVALAPPAQPTLLSPNGSIATATPTYIWNSVAVASQYLWRVKDGGGALVSNGIYTPASAACSGGGQCSITPPVTLSNGSYTWQTRAWNSSGTIGPWSSAMAFTINAP